MDFFVIIFPMVMATLSIALLELLRKYIVSAPLGLRGVSAIAFHLLAKHKIKMQIKSDVDDAIAFVGEIYTLVGFGAIMLRGLFDPFPYPLVVLIIELQKMLMCFLLGGHNLSYCIQLLGIYNSR